VSGSSSLRSDDDDTAAVVGSTTETGAVSGLRTVDSISHTYQYTSIIMDENGKKDQYQQLMVSQH
jgi:hypothetical protein